MYLYYNLHYGFQKPEFILDFSASFEHKEALSIFVKMKVLKQQKPAEENWKASRQPLARDVST